MALKQFFSSGRQASWSKQGRLQWSKKGVLNHLIGIAGIGWTTSLLAFLGTVLGYGTGLVARLVATPHSLLYVGAALFVATLGLDRLNRTLTDDE